jgi:hypothetical protein
MTWIDVADTAVKIGLGALIGGAFSFLAPFILAIKESMMERRARRIKHMEEAIMMLEQYFTFYIQHAANTCFYWTCLYDKSPALPDAKKDFQRDKEIYDAKQGLSISAMTRLLLLGESGVASDVRSISDMLYSKICEMEEPMSEAERNAKFQTLRSEFIVKRDELYRRLRERYQEEPELWRIFCWWKL